MASHFKSSDQPAGAHRSSEHRSEGAASVGFMPVISPVGAHGRRRASAATAPRTARQTDHFKPKKPSSRPDVRRIISYVLLAVGIVLLLISAGMFIKNQLDYQAQEQINQELASYTKPSADVDGAPEVDWNALKQINSEIVGWVNIPHTVVNFPVYQAKDNDKYLHTNAKGDYSVGGQIFMDFENTAPGMRDAQTIIYGHHLRNGAMFKPIWDMSKQEVFDNIPTVWYLTESTTYELAPLLVYHTDENDEAARTFSMASQEALKSYVLGLLPKATAHRANIQQELNGIQRIFTLCTCNYTDGDAGRTLLVCAVKQELK